MRSCSAWAPWLRFSRATSIPAWTSSRTRSGAAVAGPSVQTIFARRTSQNHTPTRPLARWSTPVPVGLTTRVSRDDRSVGADRDIAREFHQDGLQADRFAV